MLEKLVLAIALVTPVLAGGGNVSADYTAAPPQRVAPVGDFSGGELPGYSAYTLSCSGRVVCDSLQRFCAKEGGNYYKVSDLNGGLGVCINN